MFRLSVFSCVYLIIISTCLVISVVSIRCFSCGNDSHMTLCSLFDVTNSTFSQKCEENSKSCHLAISVIDNKVLQRSCEDIPLEDCKTANSIQHCYCTKDLCNIGSYNEDEETSEMESSGDRRDDDEVQTTAQENDIQFEESSSVIPKKKQIKPVESNVIQSDENYTSSSEDLQDRWCLLSITVLFLFSNNR